MTTLRDPSFLVGLGLAGTLLVVTLAFGGVHLWAGGMLQILVWILACAWFVIRRTIGAPTASAPWSFRVAALALVAFLAAQLLPLSPSILEAIAPQTNEIYRRTQAALDVAPPETPITPLGTQADERISVATRQDIRELARESAGDPGTARTIALDSFRSRFEILRYVAYGLVLWLAATLPRPQFLHVALVAVGCVVSLLGLAEASTRNGYVLWFFEPYDKPLPPNFARVLGPFVNADHFSGFIALTFGPALALLAAVKKDAGPHRGRKRSRAALFDPVRVAVVTVCLAILAAGLFGSGSRGGIFGAALSAVVVWAGRAREAAPVGGWKIVRGRERRNRIARLRRTLDRVAPVLLAAIVLIAGVTYVGSSGRQMLDQRLAQTVYQDDLQIRMNFWKQTLPMIPDFRWVGTGLGGWSEVVQRYQAYPNVWSRQNHNHNDYLEWLIEVGFVGVALTASLAVAYLFWARRNDSIPRLVRAGLLGSVAAVAWHEVFDFVLRVPANAVALAMILGLLCNPQWDTSAVEEKRASPQSCGLRRLSAAFAVVLAALASLQSYAYVGEFLEWKRVRSGDARITRAMANPTTWEMLEVLLARSGFRREPPTLDCVLTALKLRPTSEQAVYRLAKILPEGDARFRVLETAIFLDPTRSQWRLEYAAELERGSRLAEALFQIEEAVRLDPVLGRHPYATADPREVAPPVVAAVERGLRRALAEHGEIAAILSDLAVLLHRERRYAEAASLWLRAAHVSHDWDRFGVRAGEAFARGGNHQSAESVLKQVIAEAPEVSGGYRVLALDVLQPLGRIEEAEQMLLVGARRSRDRVALYLALSKLHRSNGRTADALQAFSEAADAAPRNSGIQYQLGVAYLEANDPHRARSAFGRAIRLDGGQAHFHAALGATQERLRELGEARRAYERAVEIEPTNPSYRDALNRLTSTFVDGRKG